MRSHYVTWIYLYLWIVPHVLLPVIAALMVRKRLYKDFPIFFFYLIFEFLQFCLLYGLATWKVSVPTYQNLDMLGRAGSIALRFGILQEMFEAPVAHCAALRKTVSRILNRATAVLVALALLFMFSLSYRNLGHRALPPYVISQTLDTAQCGLLALVFFWHRFLAMRMSPFVFGIALGMGLVAGFGPLMHALKYSLSEQNATIPDFLQMAIYHIAVVLWLYFALAQETFDQSARTDGLPHLLGWAADLERRSDL